MLLAKKCVVLILLCQLAMAETVVHKFELWGNQHVTPEDKAMLYIGWTNGFFFSRGSNWTDLVTCLNGISIGQAVAMIDRYYKDHPEKWSQPLAPEILNAMTVEGGTCELPAALSSPLAPSSPPKH